MKKVLNVLSYCPLFAGIEKSEIKNILSQIQYQLRVFEKNEFIFKINQPSLHIGIIIKGSIEAQKYSTSGKVINILYKNKGEVFGGAAAFSSEIACLYNIVAKDTSEILLIHKQSLFEVFCQNSIIASNILNLCVNSILLLSKKVELLSYSSIRKKIAFSLLHHFNSCNNVIRLPYSKKAWADYLNVSRPSLCRELRILSNAGIININGKIIKIIVKQELTALLAN